MSKLTEMRTYIQTDHNPANLFVFGTRRLTKGSFAKTGPAMRVSGRCDKYLHQHLNFILTHFYAMPGKGARSLSRKGNNLPSSRLVSFRFRVVKRPRRILVVYVNHRIHCMDLAVLDSMTFLARSQTVLDCCW